MSVSKALKTLGFIKRASKDFKDDKSLVILYNAIVRPSLEYGSVIWNNNQIVLCPVLRICSNEIHKTYLLEKQN